jgi:rubrerythrin
VFEDIKERKIFPRNLTARADRWVEGNPVSSRLESGVDNSFPGLEFDQRNLDKRFFPALEFEFHLGVPPLLRRVIPELSAQPIEITEEDISRAIILWSVYGTYGHPNGGGVDRIEILEGLRGLQSWRVIHDLEPGRIGVFLAPYSDTGSPKLSVVEQEEVNSALLGKTNVVKRDENDSLVYAVLVSERAKYLNEGVIDPDVYEPGDLTRSLCAPWQYDFADCGCFYWASNKPDMVAVEPGGDQMYNFQRIRDNDPPSGAPGSTPEERMKYQTISGWRQNTMRHRRMIEDWETLPTVLHGVENSVFVPESGMNIPHANMLSRAEIIDRLRYLARVEHGLMVEYLYAYYSIDSPRKLPEGADSNEARRFDAAKILLNVAIDEMRHFRWVNEILRELGQPPEIGRFTEFEDLDNDGRFFKHKFGLEPLTDDRLDWFINVEKPSNQVDPELSSDTIDGMYTRILMSVKDSQEFSDLERKKLLHLFKLIIDEGHDHFNRFSRLKRSLAEITDNKRTRLVTGPTPLDSGSSGKVAEIVCNRAYHAVLAVLELVFSMSTKDTGALLLNARYAMYALDDAAHELIAKGGSPLFILPRDLQVSVPHVTEISEAEMLPSVKSSRYKFPKEILEPVLNSLGDLESAGSSQAANSMREKYEKLIEGFGELL